MSTRILPSNEPIFDSATRLHSQLGSRWVSSHGNPIALHVGSFPSKQNFAVLSMHRAWPVGPCHEQGGVGGYHVKLEPGSQILWQLLKLAASPTVRLLPAGWERTHVRIHPASSLPLAALVVSVRPRSPSDGGLRRAPRLRYFAVIVAPNKKTIAHIPTKRNANRSILLAYGRAASQ
jgi:hypothetical protein